MSGLDLPEDGTGIGLSDWDGDGDIDLWVANRSAPAVRYFENRSTGARSLGLALRGTQSNRDAIGARVVVALSDGRSLTKAVAAGTGYLSQSSKRLHFGLGGEANVESVTVHWPAGAVEPFTGIDGGGGKWSLVEGTGEAARLTLPPEAKADPIAETEPAPPGAAFSVGLGIPLPMPPLAYLGADGTRQPVVASQSPSGVLLCLWASWCAPCLAELKEAEAHRGALADAGVEVIAVSVDSVGDGGDRAKADRRLTEIGWGGRRGFADERLVELLQLANDELFVARRPLPVPCSFLFDPNGRLVAVYKGAADFDNVTTQVGWLSLPFEERRAKVQPFPGRWAGAPKNFVMLDFAYRLFQRGHLEEGQAYIESYRRFMEPQPLFPLVLLAAGRELIAGGEAVDGVKRLREVLEREPENVAALVGLSRAVSESPPLGAEGEALRLAQKAVDLTGGRDRAALEALAAAQKNRTPAPLPGDKSPSP